MFSSPGLRFWRAARPVEPEQESEEESEAEQPAEPEATPAQQETTLVDHSSEPQAPASTEVEAETDELYMAEDPRNENPDAEQARPPTTGA